MPVSSGPKPSGGMSFMPKGATLSKNVKRLKEPEYSDSHFGEKQAYIPPNDDSNESLNSDDGSKYSYEESEDEEKQIHGLDPYDLLDTSQLSPMHSADESPDAVDINSLVQLSTKLQPKFDNSKKSEQLENTINKENSTSLSLRKIGQPSILKPLAQSVKKEGSFIGSKPSKKQTAKQNKYSSENETDFEDKVSALNNEQKSMLEQIQKEWLKMQNEVEEQEKEKYEEMKKYISKKLEEDEKKLRNENSEKISEIKSELHKKIENEESVAEKNLEALKKSNQEKMKAEEEKLQKKIEALSVSLQAEIKKLEEKNAEELAQKQKELEAASKIDLEKLQFARDSNKKAAEEAHLAEISNLQENHKQKITKILGEMEIEENETLNKVKNTKSSKILESQKDYEHLNKLIEEERTKYESLLREKENILHEIEAIKNNLEKIKNETAESQTIMQDLQDEADKIENDLDLLRSEKSALISELNILKESIKNENSNLMNLENKIKSETAAKCSKKYSEVGINTYSTAIDAPCKASQISVSCNEASCQIGNVIAVTEMSCQVSVLQEVACKSCQVDLVPYAKEKQKVKKDVGRDNLSHSDIEDKTLENALSGFGTKMDSRISVIEHQLKLLQENIPRSSHQPEYTSQESIHNNFLELPSVPNANNRNILLNQLNDSSVPLGYFSDSIPSSSQNKCKCELGDAASCEVMRDMRNSIYQLNDILSHNFVPPMRGQALYQVNPPITNHSSPFESFYSQFREMQERQRLMELKHKCENEAVKLTKSSSSHNTNVNNASNFTEKEFLNPSHYFRSSNLYSINVSDDPLIRAKNVVLKEQARAWKQQQSLNPSIPHILSSNVNSTIERSQLSSVGLNAPFNNMSSNHQSLFNFDIDPETDYNNWMTRLNTLQLRIRSRKML